MISRKALQRTSELFASHAIAHTPTPHPLSMWRTRLSRLVVSFCFLWVAAGCSRGANWQAANWWKESPQAAPAEQTAAVTPSPEEPPPADPQRPLAYSYPDTPPVLDAKNLNTFVISFKHHRRLVLLDFWASWCRHGKAELADMARLQELLGPEGLQVISCCLDEPEHWATHTVPTLNDARANYPCVVIPQAQKRFVKEWLAVDWSYDLPARFLVDLRAGNPTEMLDRVSLAMATEHIRSCVTAVDGATPGLSATASALRFRLIDVRNGSSVSFPEIMVDPADPAELARQAVALLDAEIDRRLNLRIAVSPFMSSRSRTHASALGLETSQQCVEALRKSGYYDIIGPKQTEKNLRKIGVTALAIEFDPENVKARLGCDYLILGWLRGNIRQPILEPDSRVVGDGTTAHPEADPAFDTTEDQVED